LKPTIRCRSGRSQPVAISILVNAGEIPANTWFHDPQVGGGRMIGEGCHFIDLARFLVGHPIETVQAVQFGRGTVATPDDKMTVSFTFADGSIATLHYWANGPKSFPKERVEIFSEGRVLVIDNWRQMQAHAWPAASRMKMRQDKGHNAEVAAFLQVVASGGAPLIPFDELDEVTRASFAAVKSAAEGVVVRLQETAVAQAE
jgi:predicted dehydrogenase